jgi:uncharacterized RDD family membrane protein YckC
MTATPYSGKTSVGSQGYNLFGSIRRRVLASIAATAGWLSLVLLFLAFWASRFTLVQNIVLIVVSLIVLSAVLLGAWVSFGLRFMSRWDD